MTEQTFPACLLKYEHLPGVSTFFHQQDAAKHAGKIYLAREDVINTAKPLFKGAKVEFFLHEDQNGLGAEQVNP